MADDDRSPSDLVALLEAVERAPYSFDFFQLMRRIEAICQERPRFGMSSRPSEDAIRIGQEPSMIFAPAALAHLEPANATAPARLETFFFGLFGPNGPLPLHITEYARARLRQHEDPTFARFADIFHHRMASLFYRAWAASQPTVASDRPDRDVFGTQLGSLSGLGMASLRDRDDMPDAAKLHFSGRLVHHARNAEGLKAILGSFFAVPVAITEFVPQWVTLPRQSLCLLGRSPDTGTLGSTASAGERIHLYHHKFRIVIGPLSLVDYERLLPGNPSLKRLVPIVRNYIGDELAWDVNMILKREEVPSVDLGRVGRLGWTSWLGARRHWTDAADLFLNPHLKAA